MLDNVRGYIERKGICKEKNNENWLLDLVGNDRDLEFEDCIRIARAVYGSGNEVKHIINFCLHTNRLSDVQCAFEYLLINKEIDILKQLFEKHGYDDLLTDWVAVYKFNASFGNADFSPQDGLQTIYKLKTKVTHIDLRLKLSLLELFIYKELMFYEEVLPIEDLTRLQLANIKPSYLKSVFAARLAIFLLRTETYSNGNNELGESIALSIIVNDQSPNAILAPAYHYAGIATRFRSYDDSLEHYKNADKMYLELGHLKASERINAMDIPLLKNLWGRDFEVNDMTEKLEIAHKYIVDKNFQKAVDFLGNIEENELKESFYFKLYKAVAQRDLGLMVETIFDSRKNAQHQIIAKQLFSKYF